MIGIIEFVHVQLVQMQDIPYRDFNAALLPTVEKELVIGVRMPHLRKLALQLMKREDRDCFLYALPHKYFEENNLHAFMIASLSSYEQCIQAINHFLPYVDNWATCDSLRPKCFGKNKGKLLQQIKGWLASDEEYTVRFGLEMLMVWYLEDDFQPEYLHWAAAVWSEFYYIKMMQAWFFATALAKQYDHAINLLMEKRLPLWVHNKTIQKACESYRLDRQQKEYLRTLRRTI